MILRFIMLNIKSDESPIFWTFGSIDLLITAIATLQQFDWSRILPTSSNRRRFSKISHASTTVTKIFKVRVIIAEMSISSLSKNLSRIDLGDFDPLYATTSARYQMLVTRHSIFLESVGFFKKMISFAIDIAIRFVICTYTWKFFTNHNQALCDTAAIVDTALINVTK